MRICTVRRYTHEQDGRHQESGNRRKNRQISSLGQRLGNFDVLHINRLPSAATFMAYTTKEKAVKNDKSQSEYFQSLNGTWKFQFVPRSDQRPMDFFEKATM